MTRDEIFADPIVPAWAMFAIIRRYELKQDAQGDYPVTEAMKQEALDLESLTNTTTVSELLALLDQDTPANWERMENILGRILTRAVDFYDDREDDVGKFALAIARKVVQANGIDNPTAQDLVYQIGWLSPPPAPGPSSSRWTGPQPMI